MPAGVQRDNWCVLIIWFVWKASCCVFESVLIVWRVFVCMETQLMCLVSHRIGLESRLIFLSKQVMCWKTCWCEKNQLAVVVSESWMVYSERQPMYGEIAAVSG